MLGVRFTSDGSHVNTRILVSGAQRAAGRTGESCREKWGVGSAQAVFRVLSFKTRAPKERVQRPGQGPGADREQLAGSLS